MTSNQLVPGSSNFLETAETHIPAIVTDKHVVEGAIQGRFRLHIANESGAHSKLEFFLEEFGLGRRIISVLKNRIY